MKRATLFLALAALLLLVSGVSAHPAAPTLDGGYTLSWWTVDGGGGTNGRGGGYTLGGTAGQPDAGVWQGQGYVLLGGFWGGALAEYRVYLPLVLREA